MMESQRKEWNKRQPVFRRRLLSFSDHQSALLMFLSQHAMLHTASLAGTEAWSFEDEVLDGLDEAQIRCIPEKQAHSVAWILWHIARIEDVTMNLLLADSPQVLHDQGWLKHLKTGRLDVGTDSDPAEVAEVSAQIDIMALRGYRKAVGQRTQEIARQVTLETLKQKPVPARLQQVINDQAVVKSAHDLVETWGSWKKARLLSMPATRHSYTHLNQALRIKNRL